MPLVINTNVAALNAQRQLVSSGSDMSQAMERLSSGRRINTAADDAAGLAISNRQTSQIRGLTQAIRNANDGVSIIQTAEGAMDESTNILQRMRELAIQAANGIYSDADRLTLDAEFQQLVDELDRIAETTSFNGQNLLDGSLGNVDLQVGANANQTIDFSIQAMDTQVLGLGSTTRDVSGTRSADLLNLDSSGSVVTIGDSDVLINSQSIGAFDGSSDTFQDLIDNINENVTGISASGYNIAEAGSVGDGAIASGDTLTITLFDVDGAASANTDFTFTATTNSMQELVDAINSKTGSLLVASISESNTLVLSNDSGAAFALSYEQTTSGNDLSSVLGFTNASVTDQGGVNTANGAFVGTADDSAMFTGSIALVSDDNEAISITVGPEGTTTDLANLGFQPTQTDASVIGVANTGTVPAGTVDFSEGLETGDLSINGVVVPATTTDSLQGTIDSINSVTSETNVVASAVAKEAFSENSSISAVEIVANAPASYAIVNGENIVVNGVTTGNFVGTSASSVATQVNLISGSTGVTAYVDENDALHFFSAGPIVLTDGTGSITDLGDLEEAYADPTSNTNVTTATAVQAAGLSTLHADADPTIVINGQTITFSDLGDLTQVVIDLNASEAQTGVHAEIDTNGELSLSSTANIAIQLGNSRPAMTVAHALGVLDLITDSSGGADGTLDSSVYSVGAAIELSSINETSISIDGNASAQTATGLLNQNTELSSIVTGSAISNVSISTAASAQAAITPIDNALETINSIRSDLGAINNRLEFTMSNLANISENTSAARSRIVDADFAAETANLSRSQVLQQASQAMLAQANAQPQQVLQLLQG